MNSTAIASSAAVVTDNNIHLRPLFWPARAAVVQLLNKIMSTSVCTNWLDVFIPSVTSSSSGVTPATPSSSSKTLQSTLQAQAQVTNAAAAHGELRASLLSLATPLTLTKPSAVPVVDEGYFVGASVNMPAVLSTYVAPVPINISHTASSMALSAANAVQAKQIRHVVILRLILDPLCRDFALSIVVKMLYECARMHCELVDSPFPASKAAAPAHPVSVVLTALQQVSMYEALAHDILRGLLNTIKNAPSQPEYNDGFGAVVLTLQALTVFLRSSGQMFVDGAVGQQHNVTLTSTQLQRVFMRYGPLFPQHSLFGWKHGRATIFRDLVSSVEAAFAKSSSRWSGDRKARIIRHTLAFMTALMMGNDTLKELFRQQMMQRKKRRAVSLSSASAVLGGSGSSTFHYHDLIAVILTGLEQQMPPGAARYTVSQDTVLILLEMLLDGFTPIFRHGVLFDIQSGLSLPPEMGFFLHEHEIPKMENLTAIPLLLNITSWCDERLQFCILNTIHNLIGGHGSSSLINLTSCTAMQPPILEMILDIFPLLAPSVQTMAVKLLQSIGKRNITVAQLKRIFRLMQVQNECRPVHTWNLLDALEGMVLDAEVPKHFLFFQGRNSGLRLPSFKRWPATGGYSFSTWFCIDSTFSSHSDSCSSGANSPTREHMRDSHSVKDSASSRSESMAEVKYNPRLLCFRQDSGLGIELLFRPLEGRAGSFSLVAGIFSGSKGVPPVFTELGIVSQADCTGIGWHHVAFTHTPSGFRAKSEMVVLLDNQLSKHVVSFPRFSDEIRCPTIGDVSPVHRDDSVNTTFFGQMGAIYFFSEAIGEPYLRGIHALGPSYSQLFSDRDGVYRSSGSSHQSSVKSDSKALDGSLTPLIMLTYNPGVRKGNYFLDNTPEQNNNKWRPVGFGGEDFSLPSGTEADESGSPAPMGSPLPSMVEVAKNMNARRLIGTHICTTRDMRDSLDCLGGIKVLLPLFTQLDLPVVVSGAGGNDQPATEAEQRRLYVKVLKVFFALLRGTPENYRLMTESGFTLLAHFMDNLSPRYATIEILDALLRHCEELGDNQDWQNDFYSRILCNFKLWVFASYDVQRKLMNHLLSFAGSSANRAHKVLSARRLFDSLYFIYSCQAVQRMNASTKSRSDDAFLPRQWKPFYSLRPEELGDIRSSVLQILYITLSATQGSIDDEIGFLMNYIAHETLPVYKVEGLQLLLRLINPEKIDLGRKILNCFVSRKCIHKLMHLHSHPRAKVRLYAVICTCSVMQLALVLGKLPPPPSFGDKNNPASPSHAGSAAHAQSSPQGTEFPTDSISSSMLSPGASSSLSVANPSIYGATRRNDLGLLLPENIVVAPESKPSDIFEGLGMSVGALSSHFLWMQEQLRSEMHSGRFETDSVDRQCYIIFTALQLTMHGHSCKYLVNDVEHILSSKASLLDDQGEERSSFRALSADQTSPRRQHSASTPVERESELDIDFEFSRICLPMIIPALFEFLKHVDNIKRRTQLILRLKNSLNGFENMDTMLSVPGWQSCMFHLLSVEQSRLVQLEAEVQCGGPQSERSLVDIRNVCDIVLTMVSDIHIHAVRFGAPSISYYGVVRPCEVSDIQYHKVTTRELLELMRRDNRKVGCTGIYIL
jgi:hypothetical protein